MKSAVSETSLFIVYVAQVDVVGDFCSYDLYISSRTCFLRYIF